MPKTAKSAAKRSGILPQSEQPKLSDVAKHLVVPEGIVSTDWPAIRDRCSQFGIEFDRWQDGLGRLTFAKTEDGIYATAVGGITASIPRQVGKTFWVGAVVFALCANTAGSKVLWTAHRGQTAGETFDAMQALAKGKNVAPHVANVRRTTGEEAVVFKNDSKIMFGAREQGFGRGFTDVSVVVFDEAQILTERALDDMVPATNSVENALVIKVGTPPKPENPSEVFVRARQDALAGKSRDSLYVELGADDKADPDDWDQVAKANPSYLVGRTSKTAILRMRRNLSLESFIREGMGIWDEEQADPKVLDAKRWHNLRIDPSAAPVEGRVVYAVKFSIDGAEVALSVARKPARGVAHVEGIKSTPMGEGTGWLTEFLLERTDRAAQFVIDGKSGAGALVNDLREAGVRNKRLIIVPTVEQVTTAHAMFKQAVAEGTLSHIGQQLIDEQVESASRRKIGNAGGFGWQAPEGKSVTALEAATYALWGVMTTRRNPGSRGSGRNVSGRAPARRGGTSGRPVASRGG